MRVESWVMWLAACAAIALSTRNPLYLILLLLVVAAVFAKEWRPGRMLRFAPLVAIAAAFNAISVHFGDTILFALPAAWPLIGGIVTLEAAAYGALSGLVLACVITLFGAFSQVVEAWELVRLMPRAFYPMGVVISIAMNFVPQTVKRFEEIRESMTIRGIPLRGPRDWLPLWSPLLAGGLENASQTADALMARGFGALENPSSQKLLRDRLALLLGFGLLLAGWMMRFADAGAAAGTGLMLAGALALAFAFWLAGRDFKHTRMAQRPFSWLDGVVIFVSLLALMALVLSPPVAWLDGIRASMAYSPYPKLALPSFDPLAGVLLAALALPVMRK
ncbi:MAG TPA: energy-coupling factor transporter transmembrane component T [Thermoflexales bacterium]|nr:energy-coupling factor transporter transmembrane component T [Thermoflexales bacterium]HQW35614.1 energy-coupling factor transporter transmembrane component T [Thermoflexales bacterium]HQZ23565.1 energy-coupling factor transporter transmembrane component T [Thermoflexales bacterium]HRA00865.1 energy-coupling factor transporter transmembrane component T [Thermoflexales bacterium]